ncbi:transcription regulator HTH, apses-type DNA-binding domain-containing protein [Cladochytrium replicatum]|nr:transcription regulator HTH, apses-type DNA-binding domain-containing protein [Cladochytrium replicatum]
MNKSGSSFSTSSNQHNANKLGVYEAVYSNVPVFELMCNGVAVMRRQADSYLNATHILKVAGIEKGKRTKILEREIHTGVHEKVQGGYGKYQGTWIPLGRARELAREYQVFDNLKLILETTPVIDPN